MSSGASDPRDALLLAARSVIMAEQQLAAAVRRARASSMSWREIADYLGVTRQATWDRWHKEID